MKDPSKLALELRRYTLARGAFSQALALCDHALSLDSPTTDLAASLMAGIVVTYSRPFLKNDGVGQLPATYGTFNGDSALQHIHETALSARNWVYAHRDNINSPDLAGSIFPPEKASYVRLDITPSGHSTLIFEPAIAHSEISKFRSLVQYQARRAQADVTQLVNAVKQHFQLAPGSYRIGDTIERDA